MSTSAAFISTDLSRLLLYSGSAPAAWIAGAGPGAHTAGATQTIEMVRTRVASAADFIAARSEGDRRLALICVDVDQALCLWLRSPSDEPASLAQAARSEAEDWGSSIPIGTMQSLRPPASNPRPGASSSLQTSPLRRWSARSLGARSSGRATANRNTTGAAAANGMTHPSDAGVVLSIPDALVRLWLDALDDQRLRAGSILTLWHALASAWTSTPTPAGAAFSPQPALRSPGPAQARDEMVAIIAVEPGRRAVWAWTRGGELIVGGQATLPKLASPSAIGSATCEIATAQPEKDISPGSSAGDQPSAPLAQAFEPVGGRIALDWLAWATRLGAPPSRIVLVGPAPDCAALRTALTSRWPTAAGATIHETSDPIGQTIRRTTEHAQSDDNPAGPRRFLVRLTNRPTRALRARYRWAAVAMGLLSLTLAALALRVQRSASELRILAGSAQDAVQTILASLDDPTLTSARNPVLVLQSKLTELRSKQGVKLPEPPRPIHTEITRALDALTQHEQARLRQLLIDSRQGSFVQLDVPDRRTGEEVTVKLEQLGGAMSWRSTRSGSDQSLRFNGVWATN